ncbi:MAG TPA: hydrogenase maturation protease [Candidatus Acidoferrum sp.]|nr:hydrogenase maturation protease [Candidatus Acidoferrum sp.]
MSVDAWRDLSSPGAQSVTIGGTEVRAGCVVRLRPENAQDPIARGLDGRLATVDAIVEDIEGVISLAVVLDDDPARTLGKGRSLAHRFFFRPSEIEPVPDATLPARILIAGIGNLFFGDDAFGLHVVRALAQQALPPGADAIEFGIRGFDLAYALVDRYDAAILVDLAARGEPPGTISVIDPDVEQLPQAPVEGHGMDPVSVLALARRMGRLPKTTLVVVCEPEIVPDPESGEITEGLSRIVEAAVEPAVRTVRRLLAELTAHVEEPQS